MKRFQTEMVLKDLDKKMVLLAGPRQAGKTWLAKHIAKAFPQHVYLNYDNVLDRDIILGQHWLPSTQLLILDEIHKMTQWKNFLKGVYDTKKPSMKMIVTGSARLEMMHNVGDALAGRYFLHHLLPLSPAELTQLSQPYDINQLIGKSGFPEPYLTEDSVEVERWRHQYINSILTSDVFSIDNIQDVRAFRLTFELLRKRVGSPVLYQSLAEDVGVSAKTIKKYIALLEDLYVVFRVTPFSRNIARSILKEPKIYFFDSALVLGNNGAQFENFMAFCLYKHVQSLVDYQAKAYKLHYIRTKDGAEIDFALVLNDTIEQFIEAKYQEPKPSKTLLNFQKKYQHPTTQVVKELHHEQIINDIQVLSAETFLTSLFL